MANTDRSAWDAERPARLRALEQHVGRSIRWRRMELGVSLEQLATAVGISHQQLHKFETSTNRISVGMLFAISMVLGVGVDHFYPQLDGSGRPYLDPVPERPRRMLIGLVRNLRKIEDDGLLAAFVQVTRLLAESSVERANRRADAPDP